MRLLLSLLLLCAAFGAAPAAESPWVATDFSRLRLIAGPQAVGQGQPIAFALQLQMNPGWKTYWRTPGDAGLPPTFDWAGSENVAAVGFRFPAPHRFTLFGLDTFGYEGEVIFPLLVTPLDAKQPVTLQGRATYMICEEVCIPFEADLTLSLPPGEATPGLQAFLIEQALATVPHDGTDDGLALVEARLTGSPTAPFLEVEVTGDPQLAAPDLLVEGPAGYSFRQPEVTLREGGALLRLPIVLGPQVSQPLEGAALTLTLLEGLRGLEATVTPIAAFDVAAGGFWRALALALLGGLILNVMPCVLPVLSMKLLSVIGQGGRAKSAIRWSFLATTAGILVSFLALGVLVLGLKAGGLAFGWGVQFQEPLFLAGLAGVTVLFAWNLLGLFDVVLPQGLGTVATRHKEEGPLGHFLTGFFAVLLATPCTAPFVTPAIGFALTHGAAEILAIFAALGLGLAAPYLLVALVPGVAQRLPKPGRWMLWVRRVLALALLGTAAWLLSVLAQQVGWLIAGLAAVSLLGTGLLLTARRGKAPGLRRGLAIAAALLLITAVAAPRLLPHEQSTASLPEGWQPFDRARIEPLLAEGQVVFVDVTAAWCVTCLANKTLVLEQAAVREALAAPGVTALQADWTRPDPAIRAFLQEYERFGIPFNIVLGPAAPKGLILPEILSQEAVLDALAKAR